jgi:hypothetical protein
VCEAQLNLRKTVDGGNGVYRIFEVSPSVFHVLDAGGRTVDEFKVLDCAKPARETASNMSTTL